MKLVIENSATPFLQDAIKQVERPLVLMQAVTKAVQVKLVEHFAARQAEGNKRGWPSQKFWHGGRNSVANQTAVGEVTPLEGIVVIASLPFIHKVTGGPIEAKRRKNLRIPLRAEAYAMSGEGSIQGRVPGLFLIKTLKGAWLVKWKQTRVKGQRRASLGISNEGLEFWFRLTPRVEQDADPRALPEREEIIATIEDAGRKALPLLINRNN
jgi:hypothetical protein